MSMVEFPLLLVEFRLKVRSVCRDGGKERNKERNKEWNKLVLP